MSDCRNNVAGLLKNHKAAGNSSMSFETSSTHMAETVAFKCRSRPECSHGSLAWAGRPAKAGPKLPGERKIGGRNRFVSRANKET
uniref:Uncharacterized protein n=1 Tax=Romanomermis culicivorax TaxID=13658 RepID=A0A915KE85_ROMCU